MNLARTIRPLLLALGATAVALLVSAPAGAAATPVAVQGNHLVTTGGLPFRLLGVNRDYSELGCVPTAFDTGPQVFDGPSDQASVNAMLSWGVGAVRIPLNEACWLNINGVKIGGEAYKAEIQRYVDLLGANGIISVLDLHIATPGKLAPTYDLLPMADADHSPKFWGSVAKRFKGHQGVILDLYNEPFGIPWSCWRDGGCTVPKKVLKECKCSAKPYKAAGMRPMLKQVRKAGFGGPVMMTGLGFDRPQLEKWLKYRPNDSQLIASAHLYDFSGCVDEACWSREYLKTAAKVPVVNGEFGETDCAHGFIDRYMNFADQHGIGYLGWTWSAGHESCKEGPVLIQDYNGTPTGYGVGLRDHLRALRAAGQF